MTLLSKIKPHSDAEIIIKKFAFIINSSKNQKLNALETLIN